MYGYLFSGTLTPNPYIIISRRRLSKITAQISNEDMHNYSGFWGITNRKSIHNVPVCDGSKPKRAVSRGIRTVKKNKSTK
jgi:hypothetical protein